MGLQPTDVRAKPEIESLATHHKYKYTILLFKKLETAEYLFSTCQAQKYYLRTQGTDH